MNAFSESGTQRWLSPQQAAAYLGCSRNFLDKDRVSRLHGIPYARLGRHIRYAVADLDAFLNASKAVQVEEAGNE
jgi:DNA binding domain, excisionase family